MKTKKSNSDQSGDSAHARKILETCTSGDFDGHTSYDRLSPSQRLDALASLAVFVHEFKGKARKTTKIP